MKKCIDSLLIAGEDAEIIIVDDGSVKDDTAAIADRYATEHPTIIKAIHQENGGHGQAVNTGLKAAVGDYYKVVDSDDWVDESALKELMATLRGFDGQTLPDAIIVNYVYEHVYSNTEKVVHYEEQLPKRRIFGFEETKKFPQDKFLAMHSIIYRTSLLREIKLELPKHTFYVDNIFVYYPLPFVKTFYYLDVNFYRYFIGRDDQSVNEKVIMSRIDQHIKVTKILIDSHKVEDVRLSNPRLYKYMLSFLAIMMTINSIYLIKIGDKESYEKKKALWEMLKEKDPDTYKKCRHRFTGLAASDNKLVCGFCKFVYVIVRKIFKFN